MTNEKKLYAFRFSFMFLIIIAVIIPYFLSLGFNMREVFISQAIFGLTVAIFEVPSGYLSDMWGRKKTLLLGAFFWFTGFLYLNFVTNFTTLIIHEVIVGTAIALISGTDVSLLYDSIKERSEDQKETSKALSNLSFTSALSETCGSIIGGLLVKISYAVVIMANTVVSIFPFLIALTLKEVDIERMDKKKHKDNIKEVLFHIFKSDRLLTMIFLNQTLWGLCTFTAVWVYQKHWQDNHVDIAYFGLIWASYNLAHGVVSKYVHFLEDRFGAKPLILTLGILPILGYIGLGSLGAVGGILVGYLFQISRGITQVLLKDALNWRTPSKFRATANSLVSLFFRLGFCLIGPLTGLLIDKFGMAVAMYNLAIIFSFVFLFLLLPFTKEISAAAKSQ